MQQLNVLPINVSQSVETKDDAAALTSSSSKDGFSQHIDLHLAKSRDVSDHKNKSSDENIDSKMDKTCVDEKNITTDEQTENNSDASPKLADENDSAKDVKDVAASGKNDEIEANKVKTDKEHQVIDESELLMSFLTKVDKTLVDGDSIYDSSIDDSSIEGVKLSEMSEEQKAKYEAQLLLKSSELVADLSSVAKAVTSGSDVVSEDLSEQEKAVNLLLASSKKAKANSNGKQVNAELLSEVDSTKTKGLEVAELVGENGNKLNKENSLNLQFNAHKLSEKSSDDSTIENKKATDVTPSNHAQQLVKNGSEGMIPSQTGENSEKLAEKSLTQQGLLSGNRSIDSSDLNSSSKTTINGQPKTNVQNPFEVESKINEQIAKLIQNEKGMAKPEANLSSAIPVAQGVNKNVTAANLGQNGAESLVEESDLVESEAQLSAKSVSSLIEQSKGLSIDGNKDVKAKVLPSTDFSINGGLLDSTTRATQAAYDRIDQQSTEMLNPAVSSEVSQSQKTNSQLHQETISIFRRDFTNAVKDKVMLMISQKLQQFDITLDPPELGNMQVRVNLQGEQATVNFVVQNQQAKDALEQNMQKLKDLLSEQGVDVGDANVEQQSQQSAQEESEGDNPNNLMANTADANDVVEHSLSARMFDSPSTGVDYYA